jgi:hypothetical protein
MLDFPCLFAQFGLGKGFGRTLKLRLALWATQEVIYTFELNGDVGFAAIHTFATHGVFE